MLGYYRLIAAVGVLVAHSGGAPMACCARWSSITDGWLGHLFPLGHIVGTALLLLLLSLLLGYLLLRLDDRFVRIFRAKADQPARSRVHGAASLQER